MKFKHISLVVATGMALGVMSGCNIYKKFELPTDNPVTADYARADSMERNPNAYGNLTWQQVFTDPTLAGLINQALENNVDLKNAKLNVDAAHARLQGANLAFLPSVALAPTGGKMWNGGNHGVPFTGYNWSYSIPLSVSWEIDVFGRLLNSKRGAKAALLQSEDYRQATRSQIISAVATTYYTISALESQLELSRNTATLWGESVEVMKNLKLAGRVNEAAVVQSQAQYYSILGNITDIEVSLREAYNTMSLLLGTMPEQWSVPAQHSVLLPDIVREQIPMVELASRPDVKAAEHSLASAYYATNVARSAFYPQLSISASGGFTNGSGVNVYNPGQWFINLAGNLVAPIFSRGQNIANLKVAKAQQEQALNTFEYTVMSAAAEVSDAMITYTKASEKQQYLADQVESLTKSVEYTQELLQYGTSTYLEVLTAQQNLLAAQTGEINCRLTRERALINLYQSLGGGR